MCVYITEKLFQSEFAVNRVHALLPKRKVYSIASARVVESCNGRASEWRCRKPPEKWRARVWAGRGVRGTRWLHACAADRPRPDADVTQDPPHCRPTQNPALTPSSHTLRLGRAEWLCLPAYRDSYG